MKYKKILMIFLLLPFILGAANDRDKPEVGIVEQLGKYLPLDLTFKDSSGKDVKLNDLINKPTVLSLVYFHCPTVCKPLLVAKTDVLDRIDLTAGKDYEALTISFNEDETPENAKSIKDHFLGRSRKKIPADAWHFLTGDKETIKKLTDAVGFYFKRDGQDFIHPTGLIIFFVTLLRSIKRGKPAGANPWGGTTLEWKTSSPPPHENFLEPPVVEGGPYGPYGPFDQNGGRRPQPIHGQTDAVLSELHLKSLPKKQSFGRY